MRPIHSIVLLVASATLFLPIFPANGQTFLDPDIEWEDYAKGGNGVTSPTFMGFLPADSLGAVNCLIGEVATGRVKLYRDGFFDSTVLDLPVAALFDRGLFGIAVHPDFGNNPYVYFRYTSTTTGDDTTVFNEALDNRVERYTWDGSLLTSPQLILTLPVYPGPCGGCSGFFHQGGPLLFGPDDMLYGSLGDMTNAGLLQNIPSGPPPQDCGMLYRVMDDGSIPSDNPFFALGGPVQKVFAYGMRNCFGMDFDPLTGNLWNTDNGPANYDEINLVLPGMNGGHQLIWGPASRSSGSVDSLWAPAGSHYADPVFSWFQSFGVTSIHFMRGSGLGAEYANDAFVAAHVTGSLYHFEVSHDRLSLVMPVGSVLDQVADNDTERDLFLWATDLGTITDIETGPDGALYLLSTTLGRLFRVTGKLPTDAGEDGRLPGAYKVHANVPNPFNPMTTIRYDVPVQSRVRLQVFDPVGRIVRVLVPAREQPRGSYQVVWDGRDERGNSVPSGVYFYRFEAGEFEQTRSMTMIR